MKDNSIPLLAVIKRDVERKSNSAVPRRPNTATSSVRAMLNRRQFRPGSMPGSVQVKNSPRDDRRKSFKRSSIHTGHDPIMATPQKIRALKPIAVLKMKAEAKKHKVT
eukprot:gene10502-3219_t